VRPFRRPVEIISISCSGIIIVTYFFSFFRCIQVSDRSIFLVKKKGLRVSVQSQVVFVVVPGTSTREKRPNVSALCCLGPSSKVLPMKM
jgi:hypothetical protein